MKDNTVKQEKPLKVIGQIHIKYYVACPECKYDYDDYHDANWFEETFGSDFPIDDGYNQEFDAKCEACQCEFKVDGFEH
jgi:hypothetical protein